jgi:hypothetical protein
MLLMFRLQHLLKIARFVSKKEDAVWHEVCSNLLGLKLNTLVTLLSPLQGVSFFYLPSGAGGRQGKDGLRKEGLRMGFQIIYNLPPAVFRS